MSEEPKTSFAAVVCVYDDERWLPCALESIYQHVDEIFVLIGNKPWFGEGSDNSQTLAKAQEFIDPEDKLRIIHGDWVSETDQRNAGLEICEERGIEYCFIVDADEIYDGHQLEAMKRHVEANPNVGCWHMVILVYWKNARYRIDPPEQYKPPVFVKIGRGQFTENRLVTSPKRGLIPPEVGVCHHMSYARTDDEVYRKITTFSHADEMQPGWYENIWKAWDENREMTDLHPTHPEAYKRAVETKKEELPLVLQPIWEAEEKAVGGGR